MSFALKIYWILILLIPFENSSAGTRKKEVSNLITFRNYMLEEVNFLRMHPSQYAEERLKKDQENSTDNGAYKYLKRAKPVNGLKFNEKLNSIALDYAQYMGDKNKFSHTANGTPFTRAKKAGYTYRAMGENIACSNDPQMNALENPQYAAIEFVKMLVIDKEIKDLGHRHTLMNDIYKSVGFGFGHNPRSYCLNYVVQDFGNP